MSFLSPHLLWFGLLAVPLILLYLKRRRHRRLDVSSIMLWRRLAEMVHESMLLRTLKKLLSLLLHLAALAAIILALAQFYIAARRLSEDTRVVVLDISASMSVAETEGSRFELARKTVSSMIDGLAFDGKMMIIGARRRPAVVCPLTSNQRQLRNALQRLEPSDVEGDLAGSLSLALDVAASFEDSGVYVVSDGDGWTEAEAEALRTKLESLEPQIPVYYRSVGAETSNVGITAAELRRNPTSLVDGEIFAEVTSHQPSPQALTLTIRMDNKLVNRKKLEVAPGAAEVVTIPALLERHSLLELSIDADDAFGLDNSCILAVKPYTRLRVLLLSPQRNLWLEKALATAQEFDAYTAAPGNTAIPQECDVVICSGCLPDQVPAGVGLVVFDPPTAAERFGLRLQPVTVPVIKDYVSDHRVTAFVQFDRLYIEKAKLIRTSWGTSLLDCYRGSLIRVAETGGRRLCLVGFDLMDSTFPTFASLPVFISNLVFWAAGAEAERNDTSFRTGQAFAVADICDRPADSDLHLLDERQARVPLFASLGSSFGFLERKGRYSLRAGETEVTRLSANLLAKKETSIAPVEELGIGEKTLEPRAPFIGKVLRGPLTWLAILLLTLEAYLFHRRTVF